MTTSRNALPIPFSPTDSLTGRVTRAATPVERMEFLQSAPPTVFTDEVAVVRQTDPANMLTSQDRLSAAASTVLHTLEDVFKDFRTDNPGLMTQKVLHEFLPKRITSKIGSLAAAPVVTLPKVSVGDMYTYTANRRQQASGEVTWNLFRTDTSDEGGFIISGVPTKPGTRWHKERPGHSATIIGRNLDGEPTTEDVGEGDVTRQAVASLTHSATMFANDYAAFWKTGKLAPKPWQQVVTNALKNPQHVAVAVGAVMLTPTLATVVLEAAESHHDHVRYAGYHADSNGIPYNSEEHWVKHGKNREFAEEKRYDIDTSLSEKEQRLKAVHTLVSPLSLVHFDEKVFEPGIQDNFDWQIY